MRPFEEMSTASDVIVLSLVPVALGRFIALSFTWRFLMMAPSLRLFTICQAAIQGR